GGDAVFLNAEPESGGQTGIGLLVALLVLLVVFGTLVSALVPIGLALVSVGTGIGGIFLLAGAMQVSVSAIPVAGVVGLGDRIDTGRVLRRRRPAKAATDSPWWRFGHRVAGRPWPYLLGAIAALVVVALPSLWLQTAFPAAGDAPTHTTYRQAYDLLEKGF